LQKTVKECEKLNQPRQLFKLAPKQLVAERQRHYKNPKKGDKGTLHFSFPHEIYYKNLMNRVYKFIFHENMVNWSYFQSTGTSTSIFRSDWPRTCDTL